MARTNGISLNYIPAGSGPPCLHGSTCFRENVEDEWLIVYLLYSISRLYTQLVIRSVQPLFLCKLKFSNNKISSL